MTMWFLMLAGVVGSHVADCGGDVLGVSLSAQTVEKPYVVRARRPAGAVEKMMGRARAGRDIGNFSYTWTSTFTVDPTGAITSVCGAVAYEISFPVFSNKLACLAPVTDAVKAHEYAHLSLTDRAIRTELDGVIGLSQHEAQTILQSIDDRISRVNDGFHQTPAGAAIDLSPFDVDRCPSIAR